MLEEQHRSYKKIGAFIKEELAKGNYPVGSRLPPERDYAQKFGVSRTVIREAIIMLEIEGIVEVKKGSGVYVLSLDLEKNDEPKLDFEQSLVYQSDIGPFELLQARQLFESGVAEFAAIQATRNDVIQLREILQREQETLNQGLDDYVEDELFHRAIANITQNEVIIRIQQSLWDHRSKSAMWKGLHARIANFDYRKQWLTDHEAILTAIQRKDALSARKAMWQHLENVKQKLFELSDVDDPNFDGYLFNTSPVIID